MDEIIQVMRVVFEKSKGMQCNYITHVPSNFVIYYTKVKLITDMMPSQSKLLIENTIGSETEMTALNKFSRRFNGNAGVCFDIGHFMYNDGNCNSTQKLCLLEANYPNMYNSICELHIHDYTHEGDHMQLGKGVLDIDAVSKTFRNIRQDIVIIIESTVVNPNYDGVAQVKLLCQNIWR